MAAPRTIGNRLAPPRFILFFILLFAGVVEALAYVPRAKALMIGFDFAAAVFLVSCLPLFRHEADKMRQAARENDANRTVLLVLTLILTMVILVTVAGEMVGPRHPTVGEKLLIAFTLALAWAGANMIYALHYAHLFYTGDEGGGIWPDWFFRATGRSPIMPISSISASPSESRCRPPTSSSLHPRSAAS